MAARADGRNSTVRMDDSQNITAMPGELGIGEPGQDSMDRTAGQDSRDRKPGQESEEKTPRT